MSFDSAVEFVLQREGGYVNNPKDRGGETNYGISKRSYPDLDIKNLTREQAKEIYRKDYWQAIDGDKIADPKAALVAFDAAVNHGPGYARDKLLPLGDASKMIAARRERYQRIVEKDPSQATFSKGWENRMLEVEKAISATSEAATEVPTAREQGVDPRDIWNYGMPKAQTAAQAKGPELHRTEEAAMNTAIAVTGDTSLAARPDLAPELLRRQSEGVPATNSPEGVGTVGFREAAAQDAKAAEQRDKIGLREMWGASFDDSPGLTLLRHSVRPEFEPTDEKLTAIDIEYLRKLDNAQDRNDFMAAGSAAERRYVELEIAERNDREKTMATHGGVYGFLGGMGPMADPVMWAGALTVNKALALRGIGSSVLALQGRTAASLASGVAENVAFEASLEGMRQTITGRYDPGQMLATAAFGAVFAVPGGFFDYRASQKAQQATFAMQAQRDALTKEIELHDKAVTNLGEGATVEQIRAEMDRIQTAEIKGVLESNIKPLADDRKFFPDPEPAGDIPAARWESVGAAKEDLGVAVTNAIENWSSVVGRMRAVIRKQYDDLLHPKSLELVERTGMALADIEVLPNQVTYVKGFADGNILPAVRSAIDDLARQFLGTNTRVVVTDAGSGITGKSASGSLKTVGNVHVLYIQPGRSQAAQVRTAMHEIGHAILHEHAAKIGPELMKRIHKDYLRFLNDAAAGRKEAVEARYAPISPNRAMEAPPKLEGEGADPYFASLDEYGAEQFVKFLVDNLQKTHPDVKLASSVVDSIRMLVRKMIGFFNEAVNKGYLKADDSFEDFFKQVLAENRASRVADVDGPPSVDGIDVVWDDAPSAEHAGIAPRYGVIKEEDLPVGLPPSPAFTKRAVDAFIAKGDDALEGEIAKLVDDVLAGKDSYVNPVNGAVEVRKAADVDLPLDLAKTMDAARPMSDEVEAHRTLSDNIEEEVFAILPENSEADQMANLFYHALDLSRLGYAPKSAVRIAVNDFGNGMMTAGKMKERIAAQSYFTSAIRKANPDISSMEASTMWLTKLWPDQQAAWIEHGKQKMVKDALADRRAGVPVAKALRWNAMSPEFQAWFRNSVAVNADGSPRVVFHGTGRNLRIFRPKQANAIFVSNEPRFSEQFAEMGEDYVKKEYIQNAGLDEWEDVFNAAGQVGEKRAYLFPDLKKWWAETQSAFDTPGQPFRVTSGKAIAMAQGRGDIVARLELLEDGIKYNAAVKDAIMLRLEATQNIIPLYIRAEKPFDYESADDLLELEEFLYGGQGNAPLMTDDFLGSIGKDRQWELRLNEELWNMMDSRGESVADVMGRIKRGDWPVIEEDAIQRVIREALGRDSFYMREAGQKNLAVYDPNQVKSVFNIGEWSLLDNDISADINMDPTAVRHGLDLLPERNASEQADKAGLVHVWKKAEAWAAANPMDAAWNKRAQNLIDNSVFPIASTGLVMLKSKNPVVRMAAAQLLEDASGVAGTRNSTAAISKHILERLFMGNSVNDIKNFYALWGKEQGGTLKSDVIGGEMWARFNKDVAVEIEARRNGGQTNAHPQVKAAADMLEAAYERMRKTQIETRTLGWGALPDTSTGYMPHKMSPRLVLNATREQMDALHNALMDQFIMIEGFDLSFAANLASKYIDTVRSRALGSFDSGMNVQQNGTQALLEDAMTAMGLTPAQIKANIKKFARGGPAHTKSRLQLDLLKDYNGFKLIDLFETDQLQLLRSQAQRVSGEAALARFGIYGRPGLSQLRKAMEFGDDHSRATPRELEAFDQVGAEFLGQPFGKGDNKWLERARTLNSITRLGGIVFNQFGEFVNSIFHVGVGRTLANIGSMARLRREIIDLAKGRPVNNPLLGSVETWGAQFGTDSYKLVFPFDHPDHAYATYGREGISTLDRLLRGGSHVQARLSLWRAMHAVQERGMAEQIIAKLGHYVRNGGEDVALGQMGFSPDIVQALRTTGAFQWQGNRLVGFDITKIADQAVAEQVVHAVHRGVKQIIQGTFIGEQGKWAHDGLMKTMLQFRTFGVTAAEKQWARQRNSRGVATALGMLVMSMGVVAPVYMTRAYLNSIGRSDQEEYLERRLHPTAIARATLNYIAQAGLLGDVLDALSSFLPDAVKEVIGEPTGGRATGNTTVIGNLVAPSASYVDDVYEALQNLTTDPEKVARALPFSRLPYLLPAINALGED